MLQFNKDIMINLLQQIDQHLTENNADSPIEILLVGGALMMLRDMRDSTYDIDYFNLNSNMEPQLAYAILDVAKSNNLPMDWLNDAVEHCGYNVHRFEKELILEFDNLKVYGVSDNDLICMKLLACCERFGSDEDDVRIILNKIPEIDPLFVDKKLRRLVPGKFIDSELIQDIMSQCLLLG